MRSPYSSGRIDVWPGFTDFVTSVSLLLVLLLASAPWFLTSAILMPRVEGAGGPEEEPFNPGVVLEERQRELADQLARIPDIRITPQGQEQRIIFADQSGKGILFLTGERKLQDQFKERLRPLRRLLVQFMRLGYVERIEIEGHSDRVPFDPKSEESNWSLSAKRAVSVAEFLIRDPDEPNSGRIHPWLVTAKGYGEFKPAGFKGEETPERARDRYGEHFKYIIEHNRTEEKLARNRRIEVLLFYRWPEAPRTLTTPAPRPAAPPNRSAAPPTGRPPAPPVHR